jgi:choline dehydrogenase-like flavoprotein
VVSDDPVDVAIVGAGAAGSIYAALLAKAGKSVRVLESGPAWELGSLISSQIWARRLKWGGPPVEFAGDRPSFSHNINTGWGLGGAALHHYATWPRLHEDAFRVRSLYGRGLDWPFTYAELRPWYDQLQEEVGIAGDAAQEIWRPPGDPYPMPPIRQFAQARLLAAGFAKLGLPTSPLPVAITSTEYKGRPACIYDGWCDAGCPVLALANPLVIHQPQAIEAGARFSARSTVLRLRPAAKDRAAGIEYADAAGVTRFQPARAFVLAASVIQNPRILLNSRSPAWPEGAGNNHDQLGRNLIMDGFVGAYGLFDTPTENHMGVSAGQLMNRVRYKGDRVGAPFGGYQWQIAPSLKPNDIFGIAASRGEIFGDALHDFLRRASKGLASMVAMIEQLPDPENRVLLSSRTDRFGTPLARAQHRVGDELKVLWAHCREEGLAVMKAAGAREAWASPYTSGHLAGGTVCGTDPEQSVTDAYGRLHGVGNVIVAGAGLFPSTGGISPTYTVSALALRSASHMRDRWGEYA